MSGDDLGRIKFSERSYTAEEVDYLLGGKQDSLTFDDVPTENSANPVKSNGIWIWLTRLDGEVDSLGREVANHYEEFQRLKWRVEGIPILPGDGKDSAVQVQSSNQIIGLEVPTNSTLSQSAMSEGAGNLSGLRGYRYTNTGAVEDRLTFASVPEGWAVDDVVSVINKDKYPDCATIKIISGSTVVFDAPLPFTSIVDESDWDSKVAYVSAKPDKGDVDLGIGAHAEGIASRALNVAAHAEGRETRALGQYSHAEGRGTEAQYGAHAEGVGTRALGTQSHAEGKNTVATGDHAHAEGKATGQYPIGSEVNPTADYTVAAGAYSHAEGGNTKATGIAAHAEGFKSYSSGNYAHAEGTQTSAQGNYSHAEGSQTEATAVGAHAEGVRAHANGPASHAEGADTAAEGSRAHSEGDFTSAGGTAAHAEGFHTSTSNDCEHAQGRYNLSHKAVTTFGNSGNTLHSIGFGSADIRKNAVEVMQDGKVFIAGVGGYDGTNPAATGVDDVTAALLKYDRGSSGNTGSVTIGSRRSGSTLGVNSLANGENVTASGEYSHAGGYNTNASGNYSHAEGRDTQATGAYDHAEGFGARAVGGYSHAEGLSTCAAGTYSHAEGYRAMTARSGGIDNPENPHNYAWAWQGYGPTAPNIYHSHGHGTFNINPAPADGSDDPATGFWIGEKTLAARLNDTSAAALSELADRVSKLDTSSIGNFATLKQAFLSLLDILTGKQS